MKPVRLKLSDPLTVVPGIGPSSYLKLIKHDLTCVSDLLNLYPTRYDDFSMFAKIATLQPGEKATIKVKVMSSKNEYTRKKGMTIQKAIVSDNTGTLELIWFNQPFIIKSLAKGEEYFISGQCVEYKQKISLLVSEMENIAKVQVNTGRIVPYYTETLKVSSRFIRQKINYILSNLDDPLLDNDSVKDCSVTPIMPIKETLWNIHFPKTNALLKLAKARLTYEQLFLIRLSQLSLLETDNNKQSFLLDNLPDVVDNQFIKELPFKLTVSQATTLSELIKDLKFPKRINRLLMGDVGSGKTVVLAFLAWLMHLNHYRTVVLVPTETLGWQHYESFRQLIGFSGINIGLMTAQHPLFDLENYDLIISTHAIFHKKNLLKDIGLLIVDEQHKFGVRQRDELILNQKTLPHLLTVSATPIPRSLALTLYGDIEVSYLKEKPFSARVKTYLVPESKRASAYSWIRKEIVQRQVQVYVICAAIENQTSQDSKLELKTVLDEEKKLGQIFPDLKIAAIHSRHPNKHLILDQFRQKSIDILVSTSLIEVGLDIPDANIMLIEDADRFGLSQLHQFRGRIGRRNEDAFCFLFSKTNNEDTLKRLGILEKTADAMLISKADLEIRGPGNILGTEQHGFEFIPTEALFDTQLIDSVTNTCKQYLAKWQARDYTSILVNKLKVNKN